MGLTEIEKVSCARAWNQYSIYPGARPGNNNEFGLEIARLVPVLIHCSAIDRSPTWAAYIVRMTYDADQIDPPAA
jgi:hypothetical protein